MKVYDAAHIKNIAVVGHGSDGKTTLVEAILSNAGAIERRGKVGMEIQPRTMIRRKSAGISPSRRRWLLWSGATAN